MKAREILNIMPESYTRALMELIATEGDDTDKVLSALQRMTVFIAAITGVRSQALMDGLIAHIEEFNEHSRNFGEAP